jgi:hypothetical protein
MFSRFGIPPFLLDKTYLESNGFCGHTFAPDLDKLELEYSCYSRFIVKQTHEFLHPNPEFKQRYSTHELPQFSCLSKINDTAVHSKQTVPYGWEWYEMTFIMSWGAAAGTTIIALDAPIQMRTALHTSLQGLKEPLEMIDPYALLTIVIEQMISLYTDSIWSIRNHVCRCESVGSPIDVPIADLC